MTWLHAQNQPRLHQPNRYDYIPNKQDELSPFRDEGTEKCDAIKYMGIIQYLIVRFWLGKGWVCLYRTQTRRSARDPESLELREHHGRTAPQIRQH